MTNRSSGQFAEWARLAAVATSLPGYALGGFLLGALGARWFGWPGLRALGTIAGTLGGLAAIVVRVLRAEQKDGAP